VKFGLSMGKDKLEFIHESHKCVYILRTLKFLIYLVMVLNFCANSVFIYSRRKLKLEQMLQGEIKKETSVSITQV